MKEEPMTQRTPAIVAVQVLLTITALEFFGQIVRDSNASHLLNAGWPGHARVHLVWLLGFMGLSGLVNLWLGLFRRPFDVADPLPSAVGQGGNLRGVWNASVLEARSARG